MRAEARSCELCIFETNEKPDWIKLKIIPTVTLLAYSHPLEIDKLRAIVKGCLSVGTYLFATYGKYANEMEDQIDLILENQALIDVITTSHQDDSIEDLAHFLINAAYRESSHFRCLVIIDKQIPDRDLFFQEMQKSCTVGTGL